MKAGRRSFQTLQPLCDLIQSQLMIPDLTMLFAAFRLCEDTFFYRPCIWQTALKSIQIGPWEYSDLSLRQEAGSPV